MSAIYLAKSALPAEYQSILQHGKQVSRTAPALPHVRKVLSGLPELFKFGEEWLFKRKMARRKIPYTLIANSDGTFPLEFNCEQTPSASNRVCLASDADKHGIKRVHVNWRVCSDDVESARRGFSLLRDSIRTGSGCRLDFEEEQLREQLSASSPLGGHHMGTARMASTTRYGVVDPSCAVFGLPNLFIASSAVFPTSGYANPTLTIVAMAVRLAMHLSGELGLATRVR